MQNLKSMQGSYIYGNCSGLFHPLMAVNQSSDLSKNKNKNINNAGVNKQVDKDIEKQIFESDNDDDKSGSLIDEVYIDSKKEMD